MEGSCLQGEATELSCEWSFGFGETCPTWLSDPPTRDASGTCSFRFCAFEFVFFTV